MRDIRLKPLPHYSYDETIRKLEEEVSCYMRIPSKWSISLNDLRAVKPVNVRMLLTAQVGVGGFNRLVARHVFFVPVWLRHRYFGFVGITQLLRSNPLGSASHQIHRSNRYNNNVSSSPIIFAAIPFDTAITVGTKRILQVADHLRISSGRQPLIFGLGRAGLS